VCVCGGGGGGGGATDMIRAQVSMHDEERRMSPYHASLPARDTTMRVQVIETMWW
jgi:hypothetical protein